MSREGNATRLTDTQKHHENLEPAELSTQQFSIGTFETGPQAGSPAPVDPSYETSLVSADLAGFLSRPVRVLEETWEKDMAYLKKFNPWQLFLTDDRVREKLRGFAYIKGNLHMKFTIAGSPFFSGYMMASYNPLHEYDLQAETVVNPIYAPIRESQRLVTFLDPTLSQGGTIVAPFYYYHDAVPLVTPNFTELGEVTLRDIARLRSVSEASSRVTIVCYAWMTEVSFIGQTHSPISNPTLTIAHAEGDEPGPVSKVATAVSDAAGKLSAVPGIGKYAQATQVAAGTVATAARALGYSRPSQHQPIEKRMVFNDVPMAPTNELVPEYVFATDCRNEMTIDPNIAGMPNIDELEIEHLCNRESFLCSGTVQLTDAPGTILFNAGVTPMLYAFDPSDNNGEHHTPMSYASQLFSWWRGNLRFRFVFHTTAFHKAKVRIIHDAVPKATWTSTDVATLNLGDNYVVDLSQEREFTIDVGWTQGEKFKLLNHQLAPIEFWATNAMATGIPTTVANGMLVMTLENAMNAPYNTDPSDAEIQFSVFVSGHNMQYAVPQEGSINKMTFAPEPTLALSSETPIRGSVAHMEDPTGVSAPRESLTPTHTFGTLVTSSEPTGLIFIGERVKSLRTMIKRFTNYTIKSFPALQSGWTKFWHRSYPIPRGAADTNFPLRFMTIINYVGQMFLARRGGIRWFLHIPRNRRLYTEAVGYYAANSGNAYYPSGGTPDDEVLAAMQAIDCGTAGMQQKDGFINFMVPGSGGVRFHASRDEVQRFPAVAFSFTSLVNEGDSATYTMSVAGAEDLTFFGFIGTPIVYRGQPL